MNLGKDIGTNAEDFEHMEDFTVAETLESFQHLGVNMENTLI